MRATYKGLVSGNIRPAQRSLSTDVRSDSIVLPDGVTTAGGGGLVIGDGLTGGGAVQVKTVTVQNIPVPNPVFALRGALATQPDMTQLGTFAKQPPQAPPIAPLYEYPVVASLGSVSVIIVVLQYVPTALGWLCDKLEWSEAGLHFEVTQQFRMDYRLYNTRAPTAAEQPPAP